MVCFKVRLSDLIGCSAQGWREGFGAKISQKHVDFVLVHAETSAIALAIELDDKTHLAPDRRARDLFVDQAMGAAGIAILRVQAAARYDLASLTQAITEKVRAAA
jgi:very-short-patch-repair endonuclease